MEPQDAADRHHAPTAWDGSSSPRPSTSQGSRWAARESAGAGIGGMQHAHSAGPAPVPRRRLDPAWTPPRGWEQQLTFGTGPEPFLADTPLLPQGQRQQRVHTWSDPAPSLSPTATRQPDLAATFPRSSAGQGYGNHGIGTRGQRQLPGATSSSERQRSSGAAATLAARRHRLEPLPLTLPSSGDEANEGPSSGRHKRGLEPGLAGNPPLSQKQQGGAWPASPENAWGSAATSPNPGPWSHPSDGAGKWGGLPVSPSDVGSPPQHDLGRTWDSAAAAQGRLRGAGALDFEASGSVGRDWSGGGTLPRAAGRGGNAASERRRLPHVAASPSSRRIPPPPIAQLKLVSSPSSLANGSPSVPTEVAAPHIVVVPACSPAEGGETLEGDSGALAETSDAALPLGSTTSSFRTNALVLAAMKARALPPHVWDKLWRRFGYSKVLGVRSWLELYMWGWPEGHMPYFTIGFSMLLLSIWLFMAGQFAGFALIQAEPGTQDWQDALTQVEGGGPSDLLAWCSMWRTLLTPDPNHSFTAEYLVLWGAKYNPAMAVGQWWRDVTSLLLHQHINHLLTNIFLFFDFALGLEIEHGSWRLMLLFFVSGIAGAFSSTIFEPHCMVVAGASGAIFGVIGMHLGDTALNWDSHSYPFFRLGITVLLAIMTAVLQVTLPASTAVSSYSHIGGAVTGLALSWLVLPNLMEVRWRRLEALAVKLGVASDLRAMVDKALEQDAQPDTTAAAAAAGEELQAEGQQAQEQQQRQLVSFRYNPLYLDLPVDGVPVAAAGGPTPEGASPSPTASPALPPLVFLRLAPAAATSATSAVANQPDSVSSCHAPTPAPEHAALSGTHKPGAKPAALPKGDAGAAALTAGAAAEAEGGKQQQNAVALGGDGGGGAAWVAWQQGRAVDGNPVHDQDSGSTTWQTAAAPHGALVQPPAMGGRLDSGEVRLRVEPEDAAGALRPAADSTAASVAVAEAAAAAADGSEPTGAPKEVVILQSMWGRWRYVRLAIQAACTLFVLLALVAQCTYVYVVVLPGVGAECADTGPPALGPPAPPAPWWTVG